MKEQSTYTLKLIEYLLRERDALLADMKHGDNCDVCKHGKEKGCNCECADCERDRACRECRDEDKWEWRGYEHPAP